MLALALLSTIVHLGTLFLDILNLCSFLEMRGQASHSSHNKDQRRNFWLLRPRICHFPKGFKKSVNTYCFPSPLYMSMPRNPSDLNIKIDEVPRHILHPSYTERIVVG